MITTINPKNTCCEEKDQTPAPYPHVHDDRYYTIHQIDVLIDGINKLLIGEEIPSDELGNDKDLYIDYSVQARPMYQKQEGAWVFMMNVNALDTDILEATQEF